MEDLSSPLKRHAGREGSCSPVKRSRTNSRVLLEELYRLLDKTILEYQVIGSLFNFKYYQNLHVYCMEES